MRRPPHLRAILRRLELRDEMRCGSPATRCAEFEDMTPSLCRSGGSCLLGKVRGRLRLGGSTRGVNSGGQLGGGHLVLQQHIRCCNPSWPTRYTRPVTQAGRSGLLATHCTGCTDVCGNRRLESHFALQSTRRPKLPAMAPDDGWRAWCNRLAGKRFGQGINSGCNTGVACWGPGQANYVLQHELTPPS